MIVTEILDDGRVHTYSDAGFYILQETGVMYEDAVDVVSHTYTETDIPIPHEEPEPQPDALDGDYTMAGRILMGVEP